MKSKLARFFKKAAAATPILVLLSAVISLAAPSPRPAVDDSDLSVFGVAPSALEARAVPSTLKPDETRVTQAESGALRVQVLREHRGQLTPVADLSFKTDEPGARVGVTGADGTATLECTRPGGPIHVSAELVTSHFSVTSGSAPYRISFEAPCAGEVVAVFKPDSDGGQALGIWQIASTARAKLSASVGLGFWKRSLDFVWPASADFYSWGQVHISRGDHWDVVGHELGHGIYDLGRLGQFGGGPHKIDECYSTEMALSEGWASYFSAWISLALEDDDAKFEYMVPRRAPIRIENIPADVCKGERNEWRVTGFFWDMIDLHRDGMANEEAMSDSFARIWKGLEGSKARSASEAMRRLERSGMDRPLLELLWKLNFEG